MIMYWRPEARCHFKPGDANWNWKRDTNTSPWPGRGGVSPPGWLTPLTPVSHNLPAIIIPHHAPWLVKVDNSPNKTRNVISTIYIETWAWAYASHPLLSPISPVYPSPNHGRGCPNPGPAPQSSAHCLIRANLLERQYLGYGPILRISICPWQALTDWEHIYSEIIFYGVMHGQSKDNKAERQAFRSAIFTLILSLYWHDNTIISRFRYL